MGFQKEHYLMRFAIIILLFLVACTPIVPATTPPQLEYTPGAFISLDDERLDAGFFSIDYPDGWRIIKTSIASAPLEIVFASPDNSMTIRINEGTRPESTPSADKHQRWEILELSASHSITIFGDAPIENQDRFDTTFERVVNSIVYQLDN